MIDTALMVESGTAADDALLQWSLPADNFSGARRRSLLARALLRGMLVHATGIAPEGWTFGAEPSGRLIAHNARCGRIPSISLSHSGGWVACAVSHAGAVGIDIEVHNLRRNFTGIAATVFGPEEQRQVAGDGASGFYRIWTLKEAMAKASGVGITQVVDRTDQIAKGPKEGVWRAKVAATSWQLAYIAPASGLSLAVAILDKHEQLGQPMIPNGIPLSKIHHAAFDAHLIGIDSDYRLHVSERLLGRNDGPMLEALKRLNGGTIHLPGRMKDRPDRGRLAIRFERFKAVA